nr:GNAT family N-acetyltransferase [uncultured Lichenicoccus sp.]
MTYVLGPVFVGSGGDVRNSLKQVALIQDLIRQLPKSPFVSFRLCSGAEVAAVAFKAAGFTNSVDFTVEIAPKPAEALWLQMRDKTRNTIRRASERLSLDDKLTPVDFIDFYEENLRRRNEANAYDRNLCVSLISECVRRGQGGFVATRDASNTLQSAIFTVWDDEMEYYLLSTRSPESGNGAASLAVWSRIQHAASRGLTFDMAGIHLRGKNLPNLGLLTGFGGMIRPRYRVRRTSSIVRFAQSLKRSA